MLVRCMVGLGVAVFTVAPAAACGPLPDGAAQPGPAEGAQLILTDEVPELEIALEADVIETAPEVLEISVNRIENASQTPFSIFAVLESRSGADTIAIDIGYFSVFPADRTGTYTLRSSRAFQGMRLGARADEPSGFVLRLRLEATPEAGFADRVVVELGEPVWRSAEAG